MLWPVLLSITLVSLVATLYIRPEVLTNYKRVPIGFAIPLLVVLSLLGILRFHKINHQEMPKGDERGRMHGFQLWANLPAHLKMTAPRYQDIPAGAIPEVTEDDGTKARIICGEFWGKTGPVEGVAADPRYVDISVPPFKRKRIMVETTRNAFAYIFAGSAFPRRLGAAGGADRVGDRP